MNPIKTERLAIVSVLARNVHKTAHFYKDVLGFNLLPHHDHRIAFDLGNAILVILEGEAPEVVEIGPSFFPVLTFEVKDVHQAAQQLKEHHVELVSGVQQEGSTKWVMFYDPAGNLLELAQFDR